MPIFFDFDQLSPEWHAARRGCITASNAERLFGRPETRTKYLRQLAAERITDETLEPFTGNHWTRRGQEMEAEARHAIAFDLGLEIKQTGLCVSDVSSWFVCSPDGLVGDDMIVQLKCPAPQTHIGYALDPDTLAADYMHQVHAELVATGRKTAIIASYCPGMRLVTRAVTIPNDKRDLFSASVLKALAEIETIVEKVKP